MQWIGIDRWKRSSRVLRELSQRGPEPPKSTLEPACISCSAHVLKRSLSLITGLLSACLWDTPSCNMRRSYYFLSQVKQQTNKPALWSLSLHEHQPSKGYPEVTSHAPIFFQIEKSRRLTDQITIFKGSSTKGH